MTKDLVEICNLLFLQTLLLIYIYKGYMVKIVFLGALFLFGFSPYIFTKSRISIQFYFLYLTIAGGLFSLIYSGYNLWDSLYYTIRLFPFNLDELNIKGNVQSVFSVARWSAVLFVTSAVIVNLYHLTYDKIRLLVIKSIGNHYIIYGDNNITKTLINDLILKNIKIIVIGKKDNYYSYYKDKISYIESDIFSVNTLKDAGLNRCSNFIVLSDNDSLNLDIALFINDFIRTNYSRINFRKTISCTVQIVDFKYELLIDKIDAEYLRNTGNKKKIEFKIFNPYQARAQVLFEKYPLHLGDGVDITSEAASPVHLMIIGFGKMGKNILLQAAKIAHFPNGKRMLVTIIDEDAEYQFSEFQRVYKNIDRVCRINKLCNMNIHSSNLIEKIIEMNEQIHISYIVTCLPEDSEKILSSLMLYDELTNNGISNIPILVKKTTRDGLTNWMHSDKRSFKNLFVFGNLNDFATSDVIIGDKLDGIAKNIHRKYNMVHNKNVLWDDLNLFNKDSNRAQTAHIDTKLFVLGLQKKHKKDITQDDYILNKEEYIKEISAHINFENIAKSEHNRWCAFHYINGWQVKKEYSSESHKDLDKKLHSCLVPYEELERVSEVVGIDFKQNDRNVVLNIFDLLTESGYFICKIKN